MVNMEDMLNRRGGKPTAGEPKNEGSETPMASSHFNLQRFQSTMEGVIKKNLPMKTSSVNDFFMESLSQQRSPNQNLGLKNSRKQEDHLSAKNNSTLAHGPTLASKEKAQLNE